MHESNIMNMSDRLKQCLFETFIFCCLFFAVAGMSMYLSESSLIVPRIWLANAIGIILLLRHSVRHWLLPLIGIGAITFLIYFIFGASLLTSSYFMLIHLTEIVFTVWLLKRYHIAQNFDQNIISALTLSGIVAFISPAVTASLGTLIFHSNYHMIFWLNWFVSDGVCLTMTLPLILYFNRKWLHTLTTHQVVSVSLLTLLTCGFTFVTLYYFPFPFILVVIPLLLIAVFTTVFATLFISNINTIVIFILYNTQFFMPPTPLNYQRELFIYISTVLILITPYLLSVFISILYRTQHKLSESEALFRSTMEHSSVGMALVSTEGYWFMVNDAFCKMLEYSKEELEKLSAIDITFPDDRADTVAILKQLKTGKINVYVKDKRYVSKTGKIVWVHLSVSAVHNKDNSPKYYVGHIEDITQTKLLQNQVSYQASHDALTGLLNRSEFESALVLAVHDFKVKGIQHILCYLDLDFFKIINDSAGHAAGDALLQEIAGLLLQRLRKTDVLARLGGDEFGILILNNSLATGKEICQQFIDQINSVRFAWNNKIYRIGVSIGMILMSDVTLSASQLLSDADVACYTAKANGRNQIFVYQTSEAESIKRHQGLITANTLQEAIDNNKLILYAQKIVTTKPDKDSNQYIEILLRLLNENNQIVSAADFIIIAESFDLMRSIDRWVLTQILEQNGMKLSQCTNMVFSINLSGNSLNDPNFLPFLLSLIQKSAIPPERLCFELTETAVMTHISKTILIFSELQRLGCKIALDDFGVGLSSFNYIRNLNVDFIKIDGSFVKNMRTQKVDKIIVQSINNMSHKLGIKTIAEHVENTEILRMISKIGVDYLQGYAIHEPEPLDNIINPKKNKIK